MTSSLSSSLYSKANEAFVDEDYEEALKLYNAVITAEPTNPTYIAKRATCHNKLENYDSAIVDSDRAITLDPASWQGYMQKGIAMFYLEEVVTARSMFKKGLALSNHGKQKGFKTWIRKAEAEMDEEELREEKRKEEVKEERKEVPDKVCPTFTSVTKNNDLRIKHEWYQTDHQVVVSILIKKAHKDDVNVTSQDRTSSIDITLPTGATYNLELDLCEEIEPTQTKVNILGTRVEVCLSKRVKGKYWASLESTHEQTFSKPIARGQKDWDKLVVEIEKETKEEKPEGDQAINQLFKEIYANADEDTRRAMNKSFQESGGTVLSTNWKDIGAKKTEMTAPQGMEVKKYEM